jgi:ABC-type sugar transport system permease subunit
MAKQKKKLTLLQRQNRTGYLFLSLWLIGFLLLVGYPFFYTIFSSFQTVTKTVIGWRFDFVGMDNFFSAFFRNTSFTPLLFEFIVLEITYVPTILVLSFILAVLLNQQLKFRDMFRVIYFFPVIVLSGPVINQLVSSNTTQLGNVDQVFVYQIIQSYSPWLADILFDLFNNFTLVLWFTGVPIVLFINGLQKINPQLYEAASLDGASSWQMLWKITIPLIKPTALITSIFIIVQLATYSINPVYQFVLTAITSNFSAGLGFASTVSLIFSVMVFIFVGVAFLLFKDQQKEYRYVDVIKEQNKRRLNQLEQHRRDKLGFIGRLKEDWNELTKMLLNKEKSHRD